MADVRWTLIVCLVWLLAACWAQESRTGGRSSSDDLMAIEDHLEYPQRPADYQTFRKELMYPYDRNDLQTIDSSKLESEISLQARLPFFGFHYKYIKIKFCQICPSEIREDAHAESGVYFRLFRIGEHNDRDPEQWLERRAIEDFREGMIGAADFRPTFVVIATWRNVTLTGMQSKSNVKTNTYQVVLASDERRTYVMFNYEKIDWIAVNDVNNGENGENPFVGFNAGNTTRYYEFIPYSQEPRVKNLPQHGEGNGIKGRYIFEIEEEIWHGSCIKWELVPHLITSRPRLTFFPKYASMLGGALINVTGPCFDPNEKIECQFQDMSGHRLPAIYRDTNHATCLMPPVFFHGYVDLTVSQGSRDAYVLRALLRP
ncbi:hypothetical protein HPB51_003460 [Rhipicephalus microplus]|uniref:NIDO domain-containing protein n=1 Tax=Rhipicephalus microplus TaxID=6941 RepID=A0A9J6EF25_RHIMP|nr:hypothetical protein HPB51_003460 [Rhipicephalus microplus]